MLFYNSLFDPSNPISESERNEPQPPHERKRGEREREEEEKKPDPLRPYSSVGSCVSFNEIEEEKLLCFHSHANGR